MFFDRYKIYPYKRDGKFTLHVVFQDELRKEIRRSTGISYKPGVGKAKLNTLYRVAENKALLIIERYSNKRKQQIDLASGGMLLSTFLDTHYLPYLKTNRRPGTVVRVENDLKKFIRIVGDKQLIKYQRIEAEAFKNKRLDEGLAKTTIDIEVRSIKTVFMSAVKWDLLGKSPYTGEQMLFKVKSARRAFTERELNALFEISESTIAGMIFRLAYYTGMRKGELSSLTWSMFDEHNKALLLPAEFTKSGKSRYIPLNSKALLIIYEFEKLFKARVHKHAHFYKDKAKPECHILQKERGWGKYECRSIGDAFRKARDKAGLPAELKFHCLRHSTATHSISRGIELSKISKILGHSSVAVTQQFYDHTTALAHRDAVDVLC